ncbi:MAG: hypothetical protein H6Q59_2139 [Firmicutes bacterium]|nr:hypothetical protein [Bacillota bacterium]
MFEIIAEFLRNDIMINWIAPIIGTVIVVIAIKLFMDRYQSKTVISIINVANNRFIDAIRPFFIQEIEINMKIVNNIRNAIKREYCADDNMLYTMEQLEEQIILDISETKYLTEERKKELIHNVYSKFEELKSEVPENHPEEQTELIKSEINKLKSSNSRLFILFILVIMMTIIILINYFYTLDFSNLYLLIIILPLIMFIVEMITDNMVQNKKHAIKKEELKYQPDKSDVKPVSGQQ